MQQLSALLQSNTMAFSAVQQSAGFVQVLESHGKSFKIENSRPGKSWKMTKVLESPGIPLQQTFIFAVELMLRRVFSIKNMLVHSGHVHRGSLSYFKFFVFVAPIGGSYRNK